ncbi:MAG TPA: 2-oxoacid:acceptor oxidoreductase family protein, partial [bacterium]|nr:2-oxoacid:acceptor oxidoreductase family protein [bacterium]
PLESLRYLDFLTPDGWIVTSSAPVKNITTYPDEQELVNALQQRPHTLVIPAEQLAKEAGSLKAQNMVMLGAAAPFLNLQPDLLKKHVTTLFVRRGETILQANLQAFQRGYEEGAAHVNAL